MRIVELAKCEWCGASDVRWPWSSTHCKPECEKLSNKAEANLLEMMAAMLWPAGEFVKHAMESALWKFEATRYRGHIERGKKHRTAIYTMGNTLAGEITCSR